MISPPAFHAAMAPAAGTAITVNAPGSTVILKGLYLNALGALTGVSVNSAAIVHIENLVVNGFDSNGIEVVGAAEVFVKDSEIRDCGGWGISAGPLAMNQVILTLDRTRLERNEGGLVADSGSVLTVRDTVAARNIAENFLLLNNGGLAAPRATIENSLAADGSRGFLVQDGARVTIRNSAA